MEPRDARLLPTRRTRNSQAMETLSEISKCLVCSEVLLGKQKKYCSSKCKTQAYREAGKYDGYHSNKRAKRRELLSRIKLERGCARCGYNEHPAALDFNHLDPTEKAFRISSDVTSLEKTLLEIEKCEVLCANCHRIHTYEQNHYTKRNTCLDNS